MTNIKITAEFGLLFAVCCVGVVISRLFPVPLPASVVSMILMLVVMLVGAVKPAFLRETSDLILANMSLFFVPAGVAILEYIDVLAENGVALIFICVSAMVFTFITTLLSVRLTVRLLNERGGRK